MIANTAGEGINPSNVPESFLLGLFEGLHQTELEIGATIEKISKGFQESLEGLKAQGETFGKGCADLLGRFIALEGRHKEAEKLQRNQEAAYDAKVAVLRERVANLEASVDDLLTRLAADIRIDPEQTAQLNSLKIERGVQTSSLSNLIESSSKSRLEMERALPGSLESIAQTKVLVSDASRSLNDLDGYNKALKADTEKLNGRINGHQHHFTSRFYGDSYGNWTNGPNK